METILCSRLRKGPVLDPYKRRIMAMPDGGSVALDFENLPLAQDLPRDAPVVILLPGAHKMMPFFAVQSLARACCSCADVEHSTGMHAAFAGHAPPGGLAETFGCRVYLRKALSAVHGQGDPSSCGPVSSREPMACMQA